MSAAFEWVNQLMLGIWGWFSPLGQYLLVTLGKIGLVTLAVILNVAFSTYFERKVIGKMQSRVGPNRVGPLGLLQPFAIAMLAIAFITEFVSGFLTVLLLVLAFRTFGEGRYYLSLYALAVAVPALVTWLVHAGVAQIQAAVGVSVAVVATALLALVAAVWAVMAGRRLALALND